MLTMKLQVLVAGAVLLLASVCSAAGPEDKVTGKVGGVPDDSARPVTRSVGGKKVGGVPDDSIRPAPRPVGGRVGGVPDDSIRPFPR